MVNCIIDGDSTQFGWCIRYVTHFKNDRKEPSTSIHVKFKISIYYSFGMLQLGAWFGANNEFMTIIDNQ